ncbi:MAG: succinate--CoA ligase subunit alpha [Candidatus Omnitrophica bacterium]|nr:succinate--CoA ligase subunit alpha [Candidatus Omnitrophota bacterium]
MSILVNRNTKVIVQGITGSHGSFHTKQMLEYGTKIVAGVTPGKKGEKVEGVPVFNRVEEAVKETGANASVIYVPARFAADAIKEAFSAGIRLVVCITEGIPALQMARLKEELEGKPVTLIGPNCPGIITPDECKIGIMPGYIHKRGAVGVLSRSGTLTYEAVWQMTSRGIGQSTCIGIGGDPILGTTFVEGLELFEKDPETKATLLIGEIGGSAEEEASELIERKVSKPVIAFVAGQTAPPGKRMGHAGAIIGGSSERAQDKIARLRKAGVHVADSPARIGEAVEEALRSKK